MKYFGGWKGEAFGWGSKILLLLESFLLSWILKRNSGFWKTGQFDLVLGSLASGLEKNGLLVGQRGFIASLILRLKLKPPKSES